MDNYGIGAAALGGFRIAMAAQRRSGRTTDMLDSLKPGDRVVFLNERERQRVTALAKERGIDLDGIVCEPGNWPIERGTPKGRLIFDHSWVEAYYADTIQRAIDDLKHYTVELSGYGEAHRETRRAAQNISRFRL